ncbi:MAG: lytic transglycosylase domain-containing protein [Bryobacteraceae bacterium]|nr:lytic transglycosylase domain-containing protein [Bryobacteraceae bacterium]
MLILMAAPLAAGEFAVLSNGFRIAADRHERVGDRILLHTEKGITELPASQVVAIEKEEVAPAPAPAVAPEPPKAVAPPPLSPRELVDEAARRAGLPREIVHSVARAESAYRPDAVSPKGAIGIMQLMPATAAALNADPRDPRQNVEAGAMYLRQLLVKYDGDVAKALAAYNAGPGAVDRYRGVPPYRETQQYVEKVIRGYVAQGGR